jgi:hypothetical protein
MFEKLTVEQLIKKVTRSFVTASTEEQTLETLVNVKVKIKLFRCLTKYHAMKTCGGVEV